MNSSNKTTGMDTQTTISTLWIVVTSSMAYADIMSLFVPGIHEELAAFAGDTPITQLMLYGAIGVEIPIIMIFLSRILKYGVNRWANIIVGATQIALVWGAGSTTPHYIFFASVETVFMLLIVWYAWKWTNPEAQP